MRLLSVVKSFIAELHENKDGSNTTDIGLLFRGDTSQSYFAVTSLTNTQPCFHSSCMFRQTSFTILFSNINEVEGTFVTIHNMKAYEGVEV